MDRCRCLICDCETLFVIHHVNSHLATSEGQKLIWEMRAVFIHCTSKDYILDEETEQIFEKTLIALFEHFLLEYTKSANALGYDFKDAEVFVGEKK